MKEKRCKEMTRLTRSQKQPSSVTTMVHGSGRNNVPGWNRRPRQLGHACSLAKTGPCWAALHGAERCHDSCPTRTAQTATSQIGLRAQGLALHIVLQSGEGEKPAQQTSPREVPKCTNVQHHHRFRLQPQRHGHIIWGAVLGTSLFFYCVRCGAHAGWCMRRLAQQCKGRPACDSGAGFRSCLLGGIHPRTGACLDERAPVDLVLHRCGNAIAPVDDLELDPHCAHRMRAVKKGPVSCHCVVCSHTA